MSVPVLDVSMVALGRGGGAGMRAMAPREKEGWGVGGERERDGVKGGAEGEREKAERRSVTASPDSGFRVASGFW